MENVYIYALIDPRDNQVRYIGKSNDAKKRYKNHFNSSRDKNTHKRNWINSVRRDGFKPELLILDEVPINKWQWWETFYISLYKTYGFKLVNYTRGGDGSTFGNKGSFKKGDIPHNKGVACKEETKQKIRENYTPNKGSYKKIIQFDLFYNIIKRYDCISDAVRESSGFFANSKIGDCCSGRRKHHRGFIWKYDDGSEIIKEKIVLLKKEVIQYDMELNEINNFNSIKDASKNTGIFEGGIIKCCKGKSITAGGYIWKYNDGNLLVKRPNMTKKLTIQYNEDLIELNRYESITEASRSTGVLISCISACCLGKIRKSGGFIWKYETI